MDIVKKIAFILLVIGGLNWGLVGLFGYDLVAELLPSAIATLVYILVGVSAVISIFAMKVCGSCKTEESSDDSMDMDASVDEVSSSTESVEQEDNSMDNRQM